MESQDLVNAIRRLKVETGSLACMGCGHKRNCGVSGCAIMREAADRIANQSTHILALQKEIEGLRRAARWVHDGLYLCDPDKNTACKKSGCKKQCFHTAFLEFADAQAEPPAQKPRWIPVEEKLYPGDPNRAAGGSGFNPFHTPAYVPNPAAPRNCCAGGFGSTKIGEEVENAETE